MSDSTDNSKANCESDKPNVEGDKPVNYADWSCAEDHQPA
jgi:hypothetical protein